MKLHEGIIQFSNEEASALKEYLTKMGRKSRDILKNGQIKLLDFYTLIQTYSNSINKLGVKIEFKMMHGTTDGEYNKNTKTILINITNVCNLNLSGFVYVTKFDTHLLGEIIVHEYVHFKQDALRNKNQGKYELPLDYNDASYWKQPWELQAQAAEYLQYLKGRLNYTDPSDIVNNLRKLGVLHDRDLNRLKRTDLKAWKRVMKNAIMMTLAQNKES